MALQEGDIIHSRYRLIRLIGTGTSGSVWAARNELTSFFRLTVYGRCAALVFFIAFVVLGFAPPTLILFGVIDAAGAVWTALCLRGGAFEMDAE